MPLRPTATLAFWPRRICAVLLAACAAAGAARAQTAQSVGTNPGSGITIQVTNVYNGIPDHGFLPLRVSITNSSNNDGVWTIVTQAARPGAQSDKHFGAEATCKVPARQTQVFEVLAPLPTTSFPDISRVFVKVNGPGVASPDLQFNSNVTLVPQSSLSVMVPMLSTSTVARGRGAVATGSTTNTLIANPDGSTTRTSVTKQATGTTVTEVVVTQPNGSTQTTTTTRDANGVAIGSTRVTNTLPTHAANVVIINGVASPVPGGASIPPAPLIPTSTTVRNTDGSTTTIETQTNADGSIVTTTKQMMVDGTTRTQSTTKFPNGTSTTSTLIKDSAGNVISPGGSGNAVPAPAGSSGSAPAPAATPPKTTKSGTGTLQLDGSTLFNGTTPLPVVTAPLAAGPNPPDAQAVLNAQTTGPDAFFKNAVLPKMMPQAGDTEKTTDAVDPLTHASIHTTVLTHADGSTTTFTATPTASGYNLDTVNATAQGATISAHHELLLSPEVMAQAIPDVYQAQPTKPLLAQSGYLLPASISLGPAPVALAASQMGQTPPSGATSTANSGGSTISVGNGTLTITGGGVVSGNVTVGANGTLIISNGGTLTVGGSRSSSGGAPFAPAATNGATPSQASSPLAPDIKKLSEIIIPAVNIDAPTPFDDVITTLTVLSRLYDNDNNKGLNFHVMPPSNGQPMPKIRLLDLHDVSLQKLLDLACKDAGYGYHDDNGVILLTQLSRPPPPPPPPPPAPVSNTATPIRAGTTFTNPTIVSGAVSGRSARGGYQRVQRTPGPPVFLGLSQTLSHDVGDRVKSYWNSICVHPIQQSTLDTNPDTTLLSADWRAYLGFDHLFFTGADWLAASPGVRMAILQWVATGGDLRLVAESDGGLDLPPRLNEHYGAGAIELFSADELAKYDFTTEHTDPRARFLFSLDYRPAQTATAAGGAQLDLPAGFERREFTLSPVTIARFTSINPATVSSTVPNLNTLIEMQLKNNFANYLIAGSQLTYDGTKLTITDSKANLDAISDQVTQLGDQPGVVVATGPALPASTGNALPALASATSTAAKTELDVKRYDDEAPHLGNQYLLVATVIICFGILVGPLNLFWFCRGARRPHLLWVTPLLAVATSVAIIAFILLAEGIGGRGVFFRVTQLLPPAVDREFAVESEVETSVTGVLTHRDFEFKYPAWVLDFRESNGDGDWDHGDFMQSGPHYTGDWFVSRREQTLVAHAVVPSRAVLHLVSAATKSKGPVLSSEYNDWMQNLFYLDADGNYWKLDKISDGKPTEMQNATVDEFKAAWDENLRSAPDSLSNYLRKLTPRPGMFFALGNGSGPVLEPEFAGLHWSRFRHVIVGPVIP